MKHKNWTKKEIDYIALHYHSGKNGKTSIEIANKLHRSPSAVRNKAHDMGWNRRDRM